MLPEQGYASLTHREKEKNWNNAMFHVSSSRDSAELTVSQGGWELHYCCCQPVCSSERVVLLL